MSPRCQIQLPSTARKVWDHTKGPPYLPLRLESSAPPYLPLRLESSAPPYLPLRLESSSTSTVTLMFVGRALASDLGSSIPASAPELFLQMFGFGDLFFSEALHLQLRPHSAGTDQPLWRTEASTPNPTTPRSPVAVLHCFGLG